MRRQGPFVGGWFVFRSWKAKTDDFRNMFFLHEHLSAGLLGYLVSNFLLWQQDCSAYFLPAAPQGETPGAGSGQFAADPHPAASFLLHEIHFPGDLLTAEQRDQDIVSAPECRQRRQGTGSKGRGTWALPPRVALLHSSRILGRVFPLSLRRARPTIGRALLQRQTALLPLIRVM